MTSDSGSEATGAGTSDAGQPDYEPSDAATERRLAVELFNATWQLMQRADRSDEDDDALVHMAHASRHHWGRVGGPEHRARGEWQCSRVYALLGRAEPSLHHAARCLALCQRYDLVDWDLAFAHEAAARAWTVYGDAAAAHAALERARAVPIADAEDRELLLADLASVEAMLSGSATE